MVDCELLSKHSTINIRIKLEMILGKFYNANIVSNRVDPEI